MVVFRASAFRQIWGDRVSDCTGTAGLSSENLFQCKLLFHLLNNICYFPLLEYLLFSLVSWFQRESITGNRFFPGGLRKWKYWSAFLLGGALFMGWVDGTPEGRNRFSSPELLPFLVFFDFLGSLCFPLSRLFVFFLGS